MAGVWRSTFTTSSSRPVAMSFPLTSTHFECSFCLSRSGVEPWLHRWPWTSLAVDCITSITNLHDQYHSTWPYRCPSRFLTTTFPHSRLILRLTSVPAVDMFAAFSRLRRYSFRRRRLLASIRIRRAAADGYLRHGKRQIYVPVAAAISQMRRRAGHISRGACRLTRLAVHFPSSELVALYFTEMQEIWL